MCNYKTIYTSVPTPDNDMTHITNEISNIISSTDCNINVTPDIINDCIAKSKRSKSDENIGFHSNHMVNVVYGCYCHCYLNVMIVHGHYPNKLLKYTIVSIYKYKTASLSNNNNDNYRTLPSPSLYGTICSTIFINNLIMLLLTYMAIPISTRKKCLMVIKIIIQLLCHVYCA